MYVSTHVSEFPINTIIAWIINDYHEQGNIIITNLLLPLGHISNIVHPLHGNPYSLTLISIDGHLHSPLIRLVDVRLSSPFLSSPQPPFYSTYSAMFMAHAHVLRED